VASLTRLPYCGPAFATAILAVTCCYTVVTLLSHCYYTVISTVAWRQHHPRHHIIITIINFINFIIINVIIILIIIITIIITIIIIITINITNTNTNTTGYCTTDMSLLL
jgi:uncharacterized BrkB/YihY/UPF0761 family membrane protein